MSTNRRATLQELQRHGIALGRSLELPEPDYVQVPGLSTGNPFIEAFGRQICEVNSFEERCAAALPVPGPASGKLHDNPIVSAVLAASLYDIVYPTPYLILLYERVLEVATIGYLRRNPLDRQMGNRLTYQLSTMPPREAQVLVESTPVHMPLSLMVVGASGMGKTFAVRHALSCLPPVLGHRSYGEQPMGDIQVLWLYVQCPASGSLKSLLLSILLSLDHVVGTQYFFHWLHSRASTDVLLLAVGLILRSHGVGVLVLDELQHLKARGYAETDVTLNFFVSLMNFLGIPIVSIGTYGALDLLATALRDGRRLCGAGTIDFARYEAESRIAFQLESYMLGFLPGWGRQKLTPELHRKLHFIYQGIHFFLPNFVHRVGTEMVRRGSTELNEDILTYYNEVELMPVGEQLMRLRSNDPDMLALSDDLVSPQRRRELLAHQKKLDGGEGQKSTTRRASPGHPSRRGAPGIHSSGEFPADAFTDKEVAEQVAMSLLLFGDGDAYPALASAGLIGKRVLEGRLVGEQG